MVGTQVGAADALDREVDDVDAVEDRLLARGDEITREPNGAAVVRVGSQHLVGDDLRPGSDPGRLAAADAEDLHLDGAIPRGDARR